MSGDAERGKAGEHAELLGGAHVERADRDGDADQDGEGLADEELVAVDGW